VAKNENRIKVKLRSTEGTGYTYMTTKNKQNQRERITMKKYDPVLRRHVEFREEK
jgi:large subunit ribosomal protein L33